MQSHGVDFSEYAIEKEYKEDIEQSRIKSIILGNMQKSKFEAIVGLR